MPDFETWFRLVDPHLWKQITQQDLFIFPHTDFIVDSYLQAFVSEATEQQTIFVISRNMFG